MPQQGAALGTACGPVSWRCVWRVLPLALAGEAIPLFARIVAVAEGLDHAAVDAGPRGAETTLHARSGAEYDPELVGVMLALCGGGLLGEWTDGGLGAPPPPPPRLCARA